MSKESESKGGRSLDQKIKTEKEEELEEEIEDETDQKVIQSEVSLKNNTLNSNRT